jgi:hypothetical protein
MCPLCKDKECALVEKPGGRIACACGKHSWPNAAALEETCRRQSLTIVGKFHDWTQSY